MAPKKRISAPLTDAITLAARKGLNVRKCQMEPGWDISLPNGSHYHAKTNADMVSYVRGY